MIKEQKLELVKVIWTDINTLKDEDTAWFSKKEAKRVAERMIKITFETVGYVVENSKDYILVGATIDRDGETFADISIIPRGVVKKITKLKNK